MKKATKTSALIISLVILTKATLGLAQINLSSDERDYKSADQFMRMCVEFNAERADSEQVCEQVWNTYKK